MLRSVPSFFRLVCVFCVCLWGVNSAMAAGEGLDVMGGLPISPSPEIVGIVPMGFGNAGMALADGTEALYLNPAGLARRKPSSLLEGGFFFNPGADHRVINVSIADSKTNPLLAAGASYSYYVAPRPDDGKFTTVSGHIARLGLASRYKDIFFIGATLKYFYLEQPFLPTLNVFNLDVGVTWQISSMFSISATGYNLIYNGNAENPLSAGLGVAFGLRSPFRASVDWIIDFQSKEGDDIGHELRAGVQYTFREIFSLRLGYQLDQVRDRRPVSPLLPAGEPSPGHFISAGLGFRYARFGFDFAFRQQLSSDDKLSQNRYLGFSIQATL